MTVQPASANDPRGPGRASSSPSPITVLVVDDAAVDRFVTGALIERALGWRVVHANNGRAALAVMEKEDPRIVLTDLKMPEMDGLGLVAAIRLQHPLVGNLELGADLCQEGDAPFYRLAEERRQQLPYRDRQVHCTARLSRDEAVYIIRDEGPGFDPSTLPDPKDPANLGRIGGRGLLLIRTFMDEVAYNPAGNQITLTKRAQRPTGEITEVLA